MYLNEILGIENDDISNYKIHFASKPKALKMYYADEFKTYQERQTKKNFSEKYIISLIRYKSDEWLFAGIYEVISIGNENYKGKEIYRYNTKLCEKSQDKIGNLILNYHFESRNVYRFLETINDNYNIVRDLKAINEEDFQSEIQTGPNLELKVGALPKPEPNLLDNKSEKWQRDPNISHIALSNANNLCELNRDHQTFIAKSTGKQFVEAHHLIPMKYQDEFDVRIDVPENIISLCPNCHRAFHHSGENLIIDHVTKFYDKRKSDLNSRGIYFERKSLIEMYS